MSALQRLQEQILAHVARPGFRPAKSRQLAKRMGMPASRHGVFRDAIRGLVNDGRLQRDRKKLIRPAAAKDRIVGTYRSNPRGFGFVRPLAPPNAVDIYIPEGEAIDAIDGDTVGVRLIKGGPRRGGSTRSQGRVERIVRRNKTRFVGELEATRGGHRIVPDGNPILREIVIPDATSRAKVGEKVVVEISQYPRRGKPARGVIVEVLGRPGEPGVDTTSIARQYDLPDKFEADELAEAHVAIEGYDPEPLIAAGRRDLRKDIAITIDPVDARDYDDAVGVTQTRDGWRLSVHIADVSHFIAPGGPLDMEAALRGTSVYFPHRVIPMIPEVLSNGICSLQEGQDRLVKSVFITYDKAGRATETDFAESVIRNRKRLTYEQAAEILDGNTDGVPRNIIALLKRMDRLARILLTRRREAGMIEMQLPEVELVYDKDNKVIDAHPEPTDFTHRIIEMFMVEANQAVAEMCSRRNIPLMRRIHPPPEPEATAKFVQFARGLGYQLDAAPGREPMQKLLAKVAGKPEAYALNLALLKSQSRANYSVEIEGHYALAMEHYGHFTSPIRRYPDLTVHRQLEWILAGARKKPPANSDRLTLIAENCNMTERRADAAVREYKELKVLEMLAEHVGDEFEGVITGLKNFGLFIQSPKYLIEGLLPIEDLGNDFFELDASDSRMIGRRAGATYRLGDTLTTIIDNIDLRTRRLRLALPKQKQKAQPTKRARKTGRAPTKRKRRQRSK